MEYKKMYQKLELVPEKGESTVHPALHFARSLDGNGNGYLTVKPRHDGPHPSLLRGSVSAEDPEEHQMRQGPFTLLVRVNAVWRFGEQPYGNLPGGNEPEGTIGVWIDVTPTQETPGVFKGTYQCCFHPEEGWFGSFPDHMFEEGTNPRYFSTWELCSN